MSIRVRCDSCGSKYRLSDDDAGRSFGCPKCGNRLHVPEPEAAADAVREVPVSIQHSIPSEPPAPTGSLIKPSKPIDFEDLIDMTAMVDIVFFLLIFFLVTSLQTVDSVIDMPRPQVQKGVSRNQVDTPEEPEDQTVITVRIDRADRITVEGVEVRGPDEIFVHLRKLRGGPGRPTVLMVVGHGDATHGTLVSVLDAGQELGFEKIQFSVVEDLDGAS